MLQYNFVQVFVPAAVWFAGSLQFAHYNLPRSILAIATHFLLLLFRKYFQSHIFRLCPSYREGSLPFAFRQVVFLQVLSPLLHSQVKCLPQCFFCWMFNCCRLIINSSSSISHLHCHLNNTVPRCLTVSPLDFLHAQ